MAIPFLLTANTLHPSPLPSSASPCSSSSTSPSLFLPPTQNAKRQFSICKAVTDSAPLSPKLTKRSLSICSITSFGLLFSGKGCPGANAAILEADDDEELMEKVKRDRKKRLDRQGVISSSNKETGYLQDLVYKLSKVGQAIDNNDLSTASSVLGGSTNIDWIKNANVAFTKISSSREEKTEVDMFNSSLASLISSGGLLTMAECALHSHIHDSLQSSITRNDVESSKLAFVLSASAFQKWTALTGLAAQLKGL